jgi:hypothetical protein
MAYLPEETIVNKRRNNQKRKNKDRQTQEESVKMINTLRLEYDHLLTSPFLTKKEDSSVPTFECTIGQRIFHNTFCNIGSGVNIMSKITYDYLFGDEPLFPTYMQLQMADQTIQFLKGIAKDIMVKIQDYYVPIVFMILNMGDCSPTLRTRSST